MKKILLFLFVSGISLTYAQSVKKVEQLDASKNIVYYSLEKNKIVGNKNEQWDIAFQRTEISLYTDATGKKKASATLLKNTDFDKLTKTPKANFAADNGKEKAIKSGSGNGWYVYNMEDHIIDPIPQTVIIVKTASGKYAKIEIQNYYHSSSYAPGFYTFRYQLL